MKKFILFILAIVCLSNAMAVKKKNADKKPVAAPQEQQAPFIAPTQTPEIMPAEALKMAMETLNK